MYSSMVERERVVEIFADVATAIAHEQPALRFFAGADPHRQRGRAVHHAKAAPVADPARITRFMLCIRPISSIFDYSTFAIMLFFFKCNNLGLIPPPELLARFAGTTNPDQTYAAALFHTGWFVESLMTQTLVIHVIRTNAIPFVQSRASWQLTMTSLFIMFIGAVLPFSPLARPLGFVPLPLAILADSGRDSGLLHRVDAAHQDVAGEEKMDLKAAGRRPMPIPARNEIKP